MIGVFTRAPKRLTLVSISTMSRSTRGRSLSFRQAVMFSFDVISSSAPVSQNTTTPAASPAGRSAPAHPDRRNPSA
jgi:hypothetical protein